MNIVQLTPGTGGMYCGNCFRDNALVAELRRLGHEALMVPLYLPLKLDEPDESAGTPIFFGGINVYLEQKLPLFHAAPNWLRNVLSSPGILARAAGHSAKTRAEDVGDILVSMLRGENGRQAREIEDLTKWLKAHARPHAICLSNALLLGMARKLKRELDTKLICFLQGEDTYVDSLDAKYREPAWDLLREKSRDVDLFVAPNKFFGDVMIQRLALPPGKVKIVPDGIHLNGYAECGLNASATHAPTVGYFARMCAEKGLHVLVDAFVRLHQRGTVPGVQLKVGGGCGPGDDAFVAQIKDRLTQAGLIGSVTFHPNLDRQQKIEFLQSVDVFSVPATYAEAFGMYLAEALAAGVPVVQPRFASFPDFVETTGGGVLFDPNNVDSLVTALEELLLNPEKARALGRAGQLAVQEKFSAETMTSEFLKAIG